MSAVGIAIDAAYAERDRLRAENDELRAEIEDLRSVLAFYATATLASFDNGYRATKALKAK